MRKVIPLRIINAFLSTPFYAREAILGGLKKAGEKLLSGQTRERIVSLPGLKGMQKSKVRQFLRSDLTVEEFFRELNDRQVQYVVLRWFDKLPDTEPGEDIDLLIADSDIDTISDLFGHNRSCQKFDLYSETGVKGYHYNNLPYYPPVLAKHLLKNRVWYKEIFAVPDAKSYFLSLAYHAVVHKGSKSGIPNDRFPDMNRSAEHNYLAYLEASAEKAGFNKQDVREFNTLFRLLETHGWAPEFDTLRKLATDDPWLFDLLPESDQSVEDGEMLVFIIRQWVLEHGKMEKVKELIKGKGVEIIKEKHLDEKEQQRAHQNIRGGKWDKGPFPKSGGPPAALVVCFDYHPKRPGQKTLKTHPFVKNENVMLKYRIRDYLNEEMVYFNHVNSIHSADNETEALEYVQQVLPEEVDQINTAVTERKESYRTEYPVLHLYKSYRTRAKIEKIDFNGKDAVKKTFKHGYDRFLEREAFAYESFSKLLKTFPPLLERGDNYVIIPWYENMLERGSNRKRKKLLRPHARQVVKSMYAIYQQGYALIGFNPDNLILTPSGEIKLIDFEFLYRYQKQPDSFLDSYDIMGLPEDFDGDLPRGLTGKGHTWNNTWKPIFGNVDLMSLATEDS